MTHARLGPDLSRERCRDVTPELWKGSSGRASQEPALAIRTGHDAYRGAARAALLRRASCNGAERRVTDHVALEAA